MQGCDMQRRSIVFGTTERYYFADILRVSISIVLEAADRVLYQQAISGVERHHVAVTTVKNTLIISALPNNAAWNSTVITSLISSFILASCYAFRIQSHHETSAGFLPSGFLDFWKQVNSCAVQWWYGSNGSLQELKRVMKVKVLVRGLELEISCGDGKQTFQWLVAAIQGRLRTFQTLRTVLDSDHYIVSEIRNLNDELINPRDKLYEHAGVSGLTVKATIDTTLSVDEWENPVMNEWQQAAYLHSAVGQHWSKEIEIWRINLAKLKDSTPATKGSEVDFNTSLLAQRVMPQTSQLIKIGFDFSQEDLESAFHLDWKVMFWEWIPLGELQKSRVGDILKSNYSLVCNIFAHYAGTGKGRVNMTLIWLL